MSDEEGGGDRACWADRTCPSCGYLDDGPVPATCPRCGVSRDPAGAADAPTPARDEVRSPDD